MQLHTFLSNRERGRFEYTERRRCKEGVERDLQTLALKIGGTQPQAKECQQPPVAGGSKEPMPTPEPLEEKQPCRHPDFGLQHCWGIHCCCFMLPSLWSSGIAVTANAVLAEANTAM